MFNYEKYMKNEFSKYANVSHVEYRKLIAELESVKAILDENNRTYENLINDIIKLNNFKIDGKEYQVLECNE